MKLLLFDFFRFNNRLEGLFNVKLENFKSTTNSKVAYKFVLYFVIFSSFAYAQPGKDGSVTITAANTVLNRYTRVAADITAGSSTITVTDINDLNRDGVTYLPAGFVTNASGFSSNALSQGDLIVLYQAQGAIINTTNTLNYGSISNYNGAGTYELAYVESVAGNVITLSCTTKLSYFADRYVQVIRIPQYSTLTVNAAASVVAIPWGATSFGGADASATTRRRGGFNAFNATNLVNNGLIHANNAGFRGGTIDNDTSAVGASFQQNFFSNLTTSGAEKGESIAGFNIDYDALGGRYGRGAAANGGGGGNGHNAGGGGGANGGNPLNWFRGAGIMNDFGGCGSPGAWVLDPAYIANGNALTNSSGGGRGGYSYGSVNIDACVSGPSYPANFIAPGIPATDVVVSGWGGDRRDAIGGLGGRPITSSNFQNQIFFGGGGGAGDGNNNANSDGGDGGGIVFIIVNNAISGTGSIQSNGQNGPNTIGGHNDAPGGGGGGGSVLIQSTTIAATQTINANGGRGGNQLITGSESEGPGGGGGGGVVTINATTDASSKTVIGGLNGITTSTAVTEFPANGATSGNSGTIASLTNNLNTLVLTVTPTVAVTAPTCSAAATNILSVYDGALTYTSTPSGLSVGAGGVITGGINGTSYTITATNASSCSATSASFIYNGAAQLAVPAAPTASVTVQPTCITTTGTIVVTAPAPAANVTYTVTGTSPVVAAVTQATATFAGLTPGAYSVTTTNTTTGCVSTGTSLTVGNIICANDDNFTSTPVSVGESTGTVINNDTLNGSGPVVIGTNPGQVTLTGVTVPTGLTLNADGTITVNPLTPSGTYTVVYEICEVGAVPTNCDQATATVVVLNPIVANDDTPAVVTVGDSTPSVVLNDTLDGSGPVVIGTNPTEVILTGLTVPTGLTLNADGTITVNPLTPSGIYLVVYEICEVGATPTPPGNCDTATATVVVLNPIDAVNDTPAVVTVGDSTPSVVLNDTLDGSGPVVIGTNLGEVTLTGVTVPTGLTLNADGTITVNPLTPSGTYLVVYEICEVGATPTPPGNCDQATATVVVLNPIIANDVDFSGTPISGGNDTPSVVNNDTLDGSGPVVIGTNPGEVTLTGLTVPTGLTLNADGTITVNINTPSGTYTVVYEICEVGAVPANCDQAIVTVVVLNPIDAVNDPAQVVEINITGPVFAGNVLGNDTLNSILVTTTNTDVTPSTQGPLSIDALGNVTIAPGTSAGTYTIVYELCEVDPVTGLPVSPTNCDTATATFIVVTDSDGDGVTNITEIADGTDPDNNCDFIPANVTEEQSQEFLDGDCDGDGLTNGEEYGPIPTDPLDSDGDGIPDFLEPNNYAPSEDDLEIFNLVTPNGDNDNDVFTIRNIELYPDNTVEIYNRWGILVYEVSGYGQDSKYFRGISQGRVTISQSSELPVGTYFYVVKYRNNAGNGKERSGYLYINR